MLNTGILDPHPLHADPDPGFEIFPDPDPGLDLINQLLFFMRQSKKNNFVCRSKCRSDPGNSKNGDPYAKKRKWYLTSVNTFFL